MPTSALVVVAHHDDAILWIGGVIQRFRDWNWHVVSMCVPDPVRKDYLQRTCEALGVRSSPFTFADYQGGAPFSRNDRGQMMNALIGAVGGARFDWVLTHSRHPSGEYGGHANHSEMVQLVTALVQGGALATGMNKVAFFSYYPMYGGDGRATVARPDATHQLQLTYPELLFKCQWTMQAPDMDTSLKNIGYPCPNPEAFEGDGLQLPRPFIPR